MKKLLDKIGGIASTVAIFAGFLLALGKAFQVFDEEYKKNVTKSEPENLN